MPVPSLQSDDRWVVFTHGPRGAHPLGTGPTPVAALADARADLASLVEDDPEFTQAAMDDELSRSQIVKVHIEAADVGPIRVWLEKVTKLAI